MPSREWNPKISVSEIEPGLLLGNINSSYHLPTLKEYGIDAIVSLVDAPYCMWGSPSNRELVPEERHLFIGCLDSSTQDLLVYMADICDFIVTNRADASSEGPGKLLVHCMMGVSRSATAVIAYLMRTHRMSLEAALELVRHKRKIRPNENFLEQLQVWEEVEYDIWEDADRTTPKSAYQDYLDGRAERLKAKGLTGDEPTCIIDL